MRSLFTSIFMYACDSWTLTAELQTRIQAMEMRGYRKIVLDCLEILLPVILNIINESSISCIIPNPSNVLS